MNSQGAMSNIRGPAAPGGIATATAWSGFWGEQPVFDMRHLENPQRPVSLLAVASLLGLGFIALWMYVMGYGDNYSDEALAAFCWLYLAVTLTWVAAKAIRPAPHNWLSPDMVFWVVFSMFHISYPVLYLLELTDYSKKIFHTSTAANQTMCCVVLSVVGFLLGYELGAFGREQPAIYRPASRIPAATFQRIQTVFAIVATAAILTIAIGIGPLILMYGYAVLRFGEVYGVGEHTERIISVLLTLLRIVICIYLAGCLMRYGKILRGVLLPTMLIGLLLFFVLLGSRSEAGFAALPMVFGYHYFVRRIKIRWGLPLFLSAMIGFGVLGVGRLAGSLSPAKIVEAYVNFRKDTGVNPFVVTLREAGGTLATVNVACTYIPSTERYWYGRSVLNSVLMIIPNPIPGFRIYLAPSQWATYKATGKMGGKQAGYGSSIAMESYMNFGLLGGAAFMGLVGFLLRRWYDSLLRKPTLMRVCAMLIILSSLAMWCRNYSHHFIRPVVWTVAATWLVAGGAQRSAAPAGVRRAGAY